MNSKMLMHCCVVGMACIVVMTGCQKENLADFDTIEKEVVKPLQGVVADDSELLAATPLIVSANVKGGFSADGTLQVAQLARVKRDATAPVVAFVSPATGSTVSGLVTIKASANDNVAVSKLVISVDGATVTTILASPYTFSWNSASVANGSHTINAMAYDAAGNTSSASVIVSVSNTQLIGDIIAPSVSFSTPANGTNVSGQVSIAANASDNVGISRVDFSVDGAFLSSDNAAPYNATWNSTAAAAGNHTIMASAYDAAGNSSQITCTVTINTTVVNPVSLPASYFMQMPQVQHQGGEGSCVPFAVGYAARSAELFYKSGATGYGFSTNVFSPEFLYNQIKAGDCGSGSAITTALQFMADNGICTWQSMPYSGTNGCSLLPTAAQTLEAINFRTTGYSKLITSDITAMKSMVVANKAVIITLGTDDSFWSAGPGFIWKAYSGPMGISHAVVICGYDDSKHAYKIMNSWGTGWGDAGYSWIDYDFLPQCSFYYSYVIN